MGFNLSSLFTGTEQSRVAAIAIVIAVIAIVLSILFSNTELNIGDRVGLSVFVILFSLPSILFALFDLTCISGNTKYQSACWYYGWFLTIFISVVAVIVVMNAFMSMIAYSDATVKSNPQSISKDDAEVMAKSLMNERETQDTKDTVEQYNENKQREQSENMYGYGDGMMGGMNNSIDSQYGPLTEGFMTKSKKKYIEGFMDGGEYSPMNFAEFT
jgi:hypothetical protein